MKLRAFEGLTIWGKKALRDRMTQSKRKGCPSCSRLDVRSSVLQSLGSDLPLSLERESRIFSATAAICRAAFASYVAISTLC